MADIKPAPELKEDFLEQDAPLRGQNFACVSFVSPESVIRQRDVFNFGKFIAHVGKDTAEMFDTIAEKYKHDKQTSDMIAVLRERHAHLWNDEELQEQYRTFLGVNSDELNREYGKVHGFQTSVRGLKIRGVFESYEETLHHSKALHRKDPTFPVYIAQVGCWCPWDPSPEEIPSGQYDNEQLNTIVKNYKENAEKKDAYFQERTRNKVEAYKHTPSDEHKTSVMTLESATADEVCKACEDDGENSAYDNWLKSRHGV